MKRTKLCTSANSLTRSLLKRGTFIKPYRSPDKSLDIIDIVLQSVISAHVYETFLVTSHQLDVTEIMFLII